MPKMIFVNLPVADVEKSAAFYEAIGFSKDARFSRPGAAAAMVWSDTIVLMILSHAHFAEFTSKRIVDAKSEVEALLCLSIDSRDGVDAIVEKAVAAGGKAIPDQNRITASCMAAVSRISMAMCSSRCGWTSRRRWPRCANAPKRPDRRYLRTELHHVPSCRIETSPSHRPRAGRSGPVERFRAWSSCFS
jgi:predicted lactoylglutathione lyase